MQATDRLRRLAVCAALCLSVALATAVAGQEADRGEQRTTVSEPPATPDIIVRGRRLSELRLAIRLAEEQLFARFNDINSTDDFDIHCYLEARTGTHIKGRQCVSNSWREQDANIADVVLRRMRGEAAPEPLLFRVEQLRMQRLLAAEIHRLALEDEELGQAVVRLGEAQLAFAERTGRQLDGTQSRELVAEDGLPFEAERMFEVRIGRLPWTHLLTGRTFTIADVDGEIRSLGLDCAEQDQSLDYEPDVDWTVPAGWTSCLLLVRAKKDTSFALYEF